MLSSVRQHVFSALRDQTALKMRNGAEDVEHQLACSGGGINPLIQADQIDLPAFEVVDGFQQFLERSSMSSNSKCVS